MELQRQQQQMQQLDHHHHHHQQGMPSCPPSNSAQHLGASTSMMMGLSHQGVSASSSASSSSMAAAHHPAPPISFTPSPADPGGSASLQPNSHLSSSVDGQQLSPFTRSLMPSTPGVPQSPNPAGFLTPGPMSMPPCSTSAGQNSVGSLLSPPSFTNSPAQMGRQQQQSMHFNNSNATNNGPISNKSPPFEGMSVSTPSGAGHHHLSSGSCPTPVHTPAHKVLGTPNPLARHEDVTDDEVTAIKPELGSVEEFKYDVKATVHEDITDDEADNRNGINVSNSVLIHQQGSKMPMDANLMVKQECMMNNSSSNAGGCSNQGMHVRSEIKEENNPSAIMMMVDYGSVIKIEPVPDGVQEGMKREDSLSMIHNSTGKEQQDNNVVKMEAEEPKVSFGSASVANISNSSNDVALQSVAASASGEAADKEDSSKAPVESQSVATGGSKKKGMIYYSCRILYLHFHFCVLVSFSQLIESL